MKKLVSIIIRTLNEEKYLVELLTKIEDMNTSTYDLEVVIVDSGSTDKTLDIAKRFNCRITHIKKEDFSFGRSLNIGCKFAKGDFFILVSGHCIPCDSLWVEKLVKPLENDCSYTYGRQKSRDTTKFSENQMFLKYFPVESKVPQIGYFVNNANSAIRKDVWERFLFDEELTGCEDMFLGRMLVNAGLKLGYVADAAVYHIHNETWERVKIRYEREAIALQRIIPEIHFNIFDTFKFIIIGIIKDLKAAYKQKVLINNFYSIIRFRFAQYYGSYKGNKNHRILSSKIKEKYYYPRISDMDIK